jgi:hypothetical protein
MSLSAGPKDSFYTELSNAPSVTTHSDKIESTPPAHLPFPPASL